MIQCACGCGTEISEKDNWGRYHRYISGHNGRKYRDKSQHKREWNHRNREARYSYKVKYLHNRKVKLINLKGGKCKECGVKHDGNNACIFDFHHRKPEEKSFLLGLNQLNRISWKKILVELCKCDLLCSNCHRMVRGSGF